jgi:hypothetical protein
MEESKQKSWARGFINFDPASRSPCGFPGFLLGSQNGSDFSLNSLSL